MGGAGGVAQEARRRKGQGVQCEELDGRARQSHIAAQSGLPARTTFGLQDVYGRPLFHPWRCKERERSGDQVRVSQACQAIAPRPEQGESEGGGEIFRRSEEHTSELQSLMRISYAVFC